MDVDGRANERGSKGIRDYFRVWHFDNSNLLIGWDEERGGGCVHGASMATSDYAYGHTGQHSDRGVGACSSQMHVE